MAFIKEESEDMKIEEAFRVKHEDTEEQTGSFSLSKLNSFIEMFSSTKKHLILCNIKPSICLKQTMTLQFLT